VWSKFEAAIKNPFEVRNFYLLFLVAFVLLFIPALVIGLISRDSMQCKPYQLRFHGDLGSGKGKVYQFTYNGPASCKLKISPDNVASEDMSLWVYKPDKSIDVVDLSTLTSKGSSVVTAGKNGTYKLSVRNKDSSEVEYQLSVSVIGRK
jgi:hypothetical protein